MIRLFRFRFLGSLIYLVLTAIFLIFSSNCRSQELLTLQKAMETGLSNNFSIILQENDARIVKNNNTIGNAGFLPSIVLNATQNNTISTTHQEQFSGTTKDIANAKNNTLNIGVQLNWTLFDGMNMFVNKKMLGVLEDLGKNGTRIVVEGTIADISLTYYGTIQLGQLVRVAHDAVDLSIQRKNIAEAKLSLGAGSELMLLQSTVDLNADSTMLIRQLVLLANTKADLNRLLAREVTTPFDIHDTILINPLPPYDSLIHKALAQNSELNSARMKQNLYRLGVKQAQSDRYPQLNVNAGYSYNTLNSQTGFLEYNQSYGLSYGFSLSFLLFNGFNVNRSIKNAKILMSSGEISEKDAEEELRSSLLKLFNQYRASCEVIKMQLLNVRIAQENVDIAFEKYKLGSINDVELREIQKKLIDAEYELISAQFEAKKSEIEISRLSGDLLSLAFPSKIL
jgi:outer membrane protein